MTCKFNDDETGGIFATCCCPAEAEQQGDVHIELALNFEAHKQPVN